MSPEQRDILNIVSPLLLGLVAWFLRGMATDIKETSKAVTALVTESKLHDGRIAILEREQAHQRVLLEDLRGFLAQQGFKRRDG